MSPKALLQTSPGMVNCPQFLATTFRWEPQECLGDGRRQVLKTPAGASTRIAHKPRTVPALDARRM